MDYVSNFWPLVKATVSQVSSLGMEVCVICGQPSPVVTVIPYGKSFPQTMGVMNNLLCQGPTGFSFHTFNPDFALDAVFQNRAY